jgi:hypothetical protein
MIIVYQQEIDKPFLQIGMCVYQTQMLVFSLDLGHNNKVTQNGQDGFQKPLHALFQAKVNPPSFCVPDGYYTFSLKQILVGFKRICKEFAKT